MLTRELLKNATTRQFEDLTLPENYHVESLRGQTLRCWSMTASEKAKFESALVDRSTGKIIVERLHEVFARKFIATVGDEFGNLLFTEADLESVLDLHCGLVDKVAEIANRLNETSIEDAEKN